MTTSSDSVPITVAYGDGIGPEIMEAVLKILVEARAKISVETIEVGKLQFEHGHTSGIPPWAWDVIERNKVLLKAPITTPQGKGYKSLNVTLRKRLGLFANVRPCNAFNPFIHTHVSNFDMVIVRENEEDLYSGVEYRNTDGSYQSMKLITREGCERIIRYAFEYAVRNGRKKVSCFSKDNIMKMADGLFHKMYDEIAAEYPDIERDHHIIDIGSARIATHPEKFDVIVTLNLYGDIISDIAAEVSGSVGIAGSANIGEQFAMFEAIHGSAPDIAGKDMANPSGLLNAACMMLVHIGQSETAEEIQNAWRRTLEEGVHTGDIYQEGISKRKVGTQEFAEAVIANLYKKPEVLPVVSYSRVTTPLNVKPRSRSKPATALSGVDVYIQWADADMNPDVLAQHILTINNPDVVFQGLLNRGLHVWPGEKPFTVMSNLWRARFVFKKNDPMPDNQTVVGLLKQVHDAGLEFVQVVNLYTFDGEAGFTLGQGE